jgi:DNA polymerase epsilon subunit 1
VKWLGRLLEADRELNGPEIDALIKQSYALIGVREFCDDAVNFIDPCESYCIPEVVCSTCYYTKDLDFCRDSDLLGCIDFCESKDGSAIKIKLCCPSCSADYPMEDIKRYMLDDLERLLTMRLKQDLECGKCHSVKPDMMGLFCRCAGSYQLTVKASCFGVHETLEKRARIISRIAITLNLDDVVYFVNSFVI